jgi:hypothetical protein
VFHNPKQREAGFGIVLFGWRDAIDHIGAPMESLKNQGDKLDQTSGKPTDDRHAKEKASKTAERQEQPLKDQGDKLEKSSD